MSIRNRDNRQLLEVINRKNAALRLAYKKIADLEAKIKINIKEFASLTPAQVQELLQPVQAKPLMEQLPKSHKKFGNFLPYLLFFRNDKKYIFLLSLFIEINPKNPLKRGLGD